MNGSTKTLAEMGVTVDGTGWPHGDVVTAEVLARCHQSDALEVITELIEHVRTMGIAPHFRADRFVGQACEGDVSAPPRTHLDLLCAPEGKKLSEMGHKRACLLVQLAKIRDDLMKVFHQLASVRLDIEATNMDADGKHVPKPSEVELERLNVFQRTGNEDQPAEE
ncbi:MAG: hypothetical protein ABIG34_04795 [Candidatus Peregrinibacteria bacterium]